MPEPDFFIEHGPYSTLDYAYDWTWFFELLGDAEEDDYIATSVWASEDANVLIGDGANGLGAPTHFVRTVDGVDRTYTKVWVGAVTPPLRGLSTITNTITTNLGRVERATLRLDARDV